MKKAIIIEGMSCGHCVKRVENALKELENIESVEVKLEENQAVIQSSLEIDDELIKAAIDDAGYDVVSIVSI